MPIVEGVSLNQTGKTASDHLASIATGDDCSLLDYTKTGKYCRTAAEMAQEQATRNRPYPRYCYRQRADVICYDTPDRTATHESSTSIPTPADARRSRLNPARILRSALYGFVAFGDTFPKIAAAESDADDTAGSHQARSHKERMAQLVLLNDYRRQGRRVFFNRDELNLLLGIYSRKVAHAVWRDYAIDHRSNMAVFSVYRRRPRNSRLSPSPRSCSGATRTRTTSSSPASGRSNHPGVCRKLIELLDRQLNLVD